MLKNRHKYVVEFFNEREPVGSQSPLIIDWKPAVEWTWFQGFRRGLLEHTDINAEAMIDPIWQAEQGEPYLNGFRVLIKSGESRNFLGYFTTEYFNNYVKAATIEMMKSKPKETLQQYQYRFLAFADTKKGNNIRKPRFTTETVESALPVVESRLSDYKHSSRDIISPGGHDEMPVFIDSSVLDQAVELSQNAGSVECGGILIGHLHRDPGLPDIFLEITAQVPAKHTLADTHKLTFTHETWAAVQAAIDLRSSNEIMLGWWHSHPVHEWCKECPPEKKAECSIAKGFLSSSDCHLHSTVFPKAYTVALLISHISENKLPYSLFGWRNGLIERRGLSVIGEQESVQGKNAKLAQSNPILSAPITDREARNSIVPNGEHNFDENFKFDHQQMRRNNYGK